MAHEWKPAREVLATCNPTYDARMTADCICGHSAKLHVYPESTLYGDCHECRCELYNPPGGLKGVPIHPLFAFTEAEFRMVSCSGCHRFEVLPEGICESCGWDNDNQGVVEDTRPDYCLESPTRKHVVPHIIPALRANYCRYCLRTIQDGTTKRREEVKRFWKPNAKRKD
jgi:hypothetical protein